MGYKPFNALAKIMADKKTKEVAILEAKIHEKRIELQVIKRQRRRFRDAHIEAFLKQIEVIYISRFDCVRVRRLDSKELWEYPNFLSKYGMPTFYGGINHFWKELIDTDIPLGQRLFNRVVQECGIFYK